MATALAQQLQQVSLARGEPDKGRQRGRKSLLYDPYEAADLDVIFLLRVATEGKFVVPSVPDPLVCLRADCQWMLIITIDKQLSALQGVFGTYVD
jgi:hypothetical protein